MNLNLAEELLLLGLDVESGELILSVTTSLPYGLAGALILELHNLNKIEYKDGKITVQDDSAIGDKVLDDALHLISSAPEYQEIKYWIKKIVSTFTDIIDKLINNLVEKGVLKKEERKILWIIPVDTYPINDPLPTVHTRLRIREIVLEDTQANQKDLALLSLVKATNLIDELFLKDEKKQAANIINDLINNEQIGKAVLDINSEITAIIASSVAGSVAAASVVGTY